MKKIIGLLVLAGLVFNLNLVSATEAFEDVEQVEGPSMHFAETTYNFGQVQQGEKRTHIFRFINNGTEPVVISRVRPSCGCTVSEYTEEPVAPGETGEIHAEYNSANRSGSFSTSIRVNSNANQNPISLHIRGEVITN